MRIASVGTALPPHHYDQETLIDAFRRLWGDAHFNLERMVALHRAVCVGSRNLALPLEAYADLDFGRANDAFIKVGTDVGDAALRQALDRADLEPRDVDAIFLATVTGVATPSLDARLMNRVGLRGDVKRVPLFGLGCVAGAAGVARMHDYLRGWPEHVAVLVTVELCSLTLQRDDFEVANLIASGLFGDGAAAVVGVGEARAPLGAPSSAARGPRVLATRSIFYPDTERAMGWDVGGGGFKVVLSADVPQLVGSRVRANVDGFLADHGLARADIAAWICHPGGPRILEAFQEALALDDAALALTWRSLRELGNMSSASVLFVLHDTLAERRLPAGAHALLMAMGPGFCAELVLLQW